MNKKPEIAESESDALVLMGCLDLQESLRHPHAQSVLTKYSQPDKLAIQIMRSTRDQISNDAKLLNIRQALYCGVYTNGSHEELRSLFTELLDENEPDSTDN